MDEDRLAAFLVAFRAAFDSRAVEVAAAQLRDATGEPKHAWREIVKRLSAEPHGMHRS